MKTIKWSDIAEIYAICETVRVTPRVHEQEVKSNVVVLRSGEEIDIGRSPSLETDEHGEKIIRYG